MALSDKRVIDLYREAEKLKNDAASLQSKAEKRLERIVEEMQRRGTYSITNDGQRVTLVEPETTVVEEEICRAVLKRSAKGRAVLARIIKEVIDKKALSAELQAGNVPPKMASQFVTIKKTKPYVRGGKA